MTFNQPPSRPTFTARFDSECAACDGAIYEGDTVGWIYDEVCCRNCCEED